MVLYTLGYEGRMAGDIPVLLTDVGVTKVVDVRELPLSRKPGLSKTPLSALLQDSGLDYQHERQLGNPKPLRQWLKDGGAWLEFTKAFRRHLSTSGEALDGVVAAMRDGEVLCLLCYEADPSECHRSLVAAAIAERTDDAEVVHL